MAYIPENKYQVLYTNGSEYKLDSNNKPYVGKYIKLNNGKLFAGDHPNRVIAPLKPIKTRRRRNIKPGTNNDTYSILKPRLAEEQDNRIPIHPYTATPTAIDYSRGYFNRYLSVRLNTKQYQEISRDTFENFNIKNYNRANNKVFQIEWSLSKDNEALNTKTLTKLNYQLPGIFNYFPNKSQFGLKKGIINLTPTSRIYPTGEVIPKPLPAAYQIGNEQINTINNLEVPKSQHCGNCHFNKNSYCKKWQANIKSNYWCRTWHNLDYTPSPPIIGIDAGPAANEEETLINEEIQQSPSTPQPLSPLQTLPSREGGGYS